LIVVGCQPLYLRPIA